MPATPIAATTRFYGPGTTKIVFVATTTVTDAGPPEVLGLVDYTSPTRAEIDAGTELSNEVEELSGFVVAANILDMPDWGSTFVSKLPGRTQADDSSLTFYQDITGADVRALLPFGTDGWLLFMDGGDVAASKMDVYPVRVASVPKVRTDDAAARLRVDVAITSVPAEDVAIPAHAA
jgi:hypothetical protein